jgi:hypothetical protein
MSARWVLLQGREARLIEEGETCFGMAPQAICTKPPKTSCPWRTYMEEPPIALLDVEVLDEIERKLDEEYETAKAAIGAAKALI